MFTKICRGTLSLRALKIVETGKFSQISQNINKCNLHYMSCHVGAKVSTTALPQCTPWITKRFSTNISEAEQNLSVNTTDLIGQQRSPRRRNKTIRQADKGVSKLACFVVQYLKFGTALFHLLFTFSSTLWQPLAQLRSTTSRPLKWP